MPKKPESKASEFELVTQFFRQTLKERGISYKEFAKKLDISESGLKKILNGDDTSYQRLLQMSRALHMRLSEVFQAIDKPRTSATRFTPEQQQYFLKNMDVFHFFFRLVIERATPEQIGEEEGLKDSEVFSYLRKLDQLKIIQLLPGDQIVLPPLVPVLDFGGGPLLEKIYREWALTMAHELAHPDHQKEGKFIVRYTKMSEESYKDFLIRLRELEIEFLRRGVREMRVGGPKLKAWRWISMTDQSSYIKKIR
jgi:transcriptional regulator with XRE-family HTH domain